MYLSRDLTDSSLVTISNAFERDHTTIMHGIDKVKDQMESDEDFKTEVEDLRNSLTD